ncbi:MAG: hypothetical protein D3910_11290 [Candidatus Electrothrix sp. ATG2]|nr:hypothetical protein [Candidatus Electrothrix sp. ATG2]
MIRDRLGNYRLRWFGGRSGFRRSRCRNIILKIGEDISFQVDILLGDIAVAVGLGDEFTALAVDEQACFPVHGFDRAQAPAIVLVIAHRNAIFRHRSQPLIIGQVIDCSVRAVRGDIARGVVGEI